MERATGAKWVYVPYKGGVQAIQDTVGGQTQVLMNGMLATLPHVQSGKLKLLGVSKGTRMPLIGDTPPSPSKVFPVSSPAPGKVCAWPVARQTPSCSA